jgi:hypothetical protein
MVVQLEHTRAIGTKRKGKKGAKSSVIAKE